MNVKIMNTRKGILSGEKLILPDAQIFLETKKRYAVINAHNGIYVAVIIIHIDDDLLVGSYVDDFQWDCEVPMLSEFFVDWSTIDYGFCKLIQWAPEMANAFGGSFHHTAKRFYFDFELYQKSYEERNGIPCKKRREAHTR